MKKQKRQEEVEESNKKQKTSKSLKEYFDVPKFDTKEEYSAYFKEFSDFLLNNTILTIFGYPYRFTELEFYYTNETHFDPFTHQSDLQKTSGKWYFHTMSNGSYKA
jgi:hypothetical protein